MKVYVNKSSSDESRRKRITVAAGPRACGDDAMKMWIVVGVGLGLLLIVVIAVAASQAGRRRTYYTATQISRPVSTACSTAPKKKGPSRYEELDGMTMKEWMQKNNRNNQMLEARQQRVQSFETGRRKQL